jgi:diguanylate cyclase (GGDEF)-like protein
MDKSKTRIFGQDIPDEVSQMQPVFKIETLPLDPALGDLTQSVLFRGVPADLVDYFVRRCDYAEFQPGDVLLRPDFHNEQMYLILNGRVQVFLEGPEKEALVTLGSGECVGELSLFDGKNPSAYVVADTSVGCLVISSELLWRMINVSHGVSRNLLDVLARRIRRGNAVVSDSRRQQAEQESKANTDALTGVHNRNWLEQILIRTKGRRIEELSPLSVIMLDVDHFKKFNDTFGHKAGDLVLRVVAEAMQRSLRPTDMVARYGGEEFVVLLPYTVEEAALRVAERLRQAVEETHLEYEGRPLSAITISLGISSWCPGQPLEHLIGEADSALYRAKNKGRNCISL